MDCATKCISGGGDAKQARAAGTQEKMKGVETSNHDRETGPPPLRQLAATLHPTRRGSSARLLAVLRNLELAARYYYVRRTLFQLFVILLSTELERDKGCADPRPSIDQPHGSGINRKLSSVHASQVGRVSLHNAPNPYFTNTQPGFRSGNATIPTRAVAAINAGLLTFQRKRIRRLTSVTAAVSQSPMAILASSTEAPRIVPIAAA